MSTENEQQSELTLEEPPRCSWVRTELDKMYHDQIWGKPEHDDGRLFEMLILEGMQAGLSWATILRKRDAMAEAFDGFDPQMIARYGEEKRQELLANPGIIRNRAKIAALSVNAAAFLRVQEEFGSFDRYLWGWVGHRPIVNAWTEPGQVPAKTPLSDALSKDLLKRGFKFVGSTICYAYMQAVGLVNDHLVGCHHYRA
ncbi:DNA-3-methyladenine glycosylase I [Gorillibacterium sp. sgz500922]|uniref:DNA-3-methyladenine glycosylase I n=1 Tax=Gorillibacterium sp. sgz500922 TaxID=3446694 RepID=UPI003F66E483